MSHSDITPLPPSVRLVDDLQMGRPHVIGTYLLLGDALALVDPGPASTLHNLEAGLAAQGYALADVQTILLTHIHLDHAGGTGSLLARYPHMRVYVHQRGAPHMVAPERLISSAARLYGDQMEQLWGEIRPVPQETVTALEGGETLALGGRKLRVFDAPGHASHHLVYFDDHNGLAFTGDVAGVRVPGSPFAFPPTPPPDLDLQAWDRSIKMLLWLEPQVLLPTHFGPILSRVNHLESLQDRLHRWARAVRDDLESSVDEAEQIRGYITRAETELGDLPLEDRQAYIQAMPFDQSWAGLARYWRKRAS